MADHVSFIVAVNLIALKFVQPLPWPRISRARNEIVNSGFAESVESYGGLITGKKVDWS